MKKLKNWPKELIMKETRTQFVNRIMDLQLKSIQGKFSYCNDNTKSVLFSLNQAHGTDSNLILSPDWHTNGFKHSLRNIAKIQEHGYKLYVFQTRTEKSSTGKTVSKWFDPNIEQRQLSFDGRCYFAIPLNTSFHQPSDTFDEKVNKSLKDNVNERRKRLKLAPTKPQTSIVSKTEFIRNPDVVAEVLYLAKGVCQQCKQTAPFIRASSGTPYLEVHHKQPLAKGGDDTVENAIALCPNCHRQMHFGSHPADTSSPVRK